MERLIKGFRRNKQMILNDSVSFNESINDSGTVLEDLLASDFVLEEQYLSDYHRQHNRTVKGRRYSLAQALDRWH
jgi:hypothetical protein